MADEVTRMMENFSLLEEEQLELEIPKQKMKGTAQRGKQCLVGKLIADHLVSKDTIRAKLIRGWKPSGNLSSRVLGENLFFLEFEHEWDKIRFLEGRPWVFEGYLFSVEEFDGLTPPTQIVFEKIAFWVRMLKLPLACMSKDVGTLIVSTMGFFEEVDIDIDGVGWGEFLCVRIQLDLTKPLSRGRFLKLQGKSVWVDFQYERFPRYCFNCGIINHGKAGCLKRSTARSQGGELQYEP
ncbi:uncharacterized protein LOC132169716 [Corylus avellana]|uniref:uncharacterized protein LOC132169716 n=1 Tax=Corylus avellana TaxID=13451 RepID=UPI00286CB89C|nr:uncharacterized protein LOC132169716 [Corylus avellana]